ncbi:hypothetical protein C7N83_12005 [Neisseria iguanae]|uniref:Uncharacterized protein n=1 Tax=Neisseria iguanae TaxID=90242 RepID=A0A2P7TXK7_9NEIS|nr:hypothetical protein C7N83_11990 [Neisseria iguanae]PSJ79464.1 hypothetical protein C7N83_12005 [Neisseria iguanae]
MQGAPVSDGLNLYQAPGSNTVQSRGITESADASDRQAVKKRLAKKYAKDGDFSKVPAAFPLTAPISRIILLP